MQEKGRSNSIHVPMLKQEMKKEQEETKVSGSFPQPTTTTATIASNSPQQAAKPIVQPAKPIHPPPPPRIVTSSSQPTKSQPASSPPRIKATRQHPNKTTQQRKGPPRVVNEEPKTMLKGVDSAASAAGRKQTKPLSVPPTRPKPPVQPPLSPSSRSRDKTVDTTDDFSDEYDEEDVERKVTIVRKSTAAKGSRNNIPPVKRISTTTMTKKVDGIRPQHENLTNVPPPPLSNNNTGTDRNSNIFGSNRMTSEDIEICQRLDEEYERALEEREIGYNARYSSVRQSAFLSVFFMVAYLVLGTAFFQRQTAWTTPDSLLFSIYTITTVGYGRSDIPTTPGFQSYTIFYILVGIAALTIMVAQVYQCIALEASRAQHGRDKTVMTRRAFEMLAETNAGNDLANNDGVHSHGTVADEIIAYHSNMPSCVDSAFRNWDRAKHFFRNDEVGRSISVIFPFAGLILIGAVVVGPLEGWTFLESLYFSVVSLTTVGFGDYYPTQVASIWFCVLWLPFSVGFMSLYLGTVAAFYIRLSDRNIQRIERQMRRRVDRAKEKAERERAEVLRRAYRGQEIELEAVAAREATASDEDGGDGSSSIPEEIPAGIPAQHAKTLLRRKKRLGGSGFDALPTTDSQSDDGSQHSLFGSTPLEKNMSSGRRRQRILENSNTASMGSGGDQQDEARQQRTMQSMRDIVRAVRRNLTQQQKDKAKGNDDAAAAVVRSGPDVQFMSIRSTQTMPSHTMLKRVRSRKPSFALRVLVQERFAEIIATEIAGYQSSIEIKENTLSVTIDSIETTANKWLIPRRARKAFRAVAFEVLYFVGEHGLIVRGAAALYDLSPFEFHGLFSPLVAAMGDAETMEGWLASTDVLADVDLRRDGTRPGLQQQQTANPRQQPGGGTGGGQQSRMTATQQERLRTSQMSDPSRNLNETLNHSKLNKISPGNAFRK